MISFVLRYGIVAVAAESVRCQNHRPMILLGKSPAKQHDGG
jgi:hypothetical protein